MTVAVKGAKIDKSVTLAYRLVAPGETVTYTLHVRNTADQVVTNVVITDSLPLSIIDTSIASSGLTLTPVGGTTYAWTVGDLAAGAQGDITITGQVEPTTTPGTSITNTAVITASQGGGSSSAAFTVDWWKPVGTEGFSASDTGYEFMAIDHNDIPYVVYLDWANGTRATVMRYTGGSWQLVGPAGFSPDRVEWTRIAFDGNRYPLYRLL